ncbi:hypothetical protein [Lactococcus garvieae]|uniref:DnaD domain-containing protein n=1 Tax=Lactococcus garvieae TaxID=1363 RepID=A0A1I4GHS5_9LACT|nr:hypothetical protein [Lactococcus garvieae]SFL28857.1 hypothetical protein SAMN05216438_1049 [Lactococcus garvieae]
MSAEKELPLAREEVKDPFARVLNTLAQDDRLSFEAIGCLTRIISLPDDWIIYKSEIMKHSQLGRTRFQKMWNQLQQFGYLTKRRVHDDSGRFVGIEWKIYQNPIVVEEKVPELPDVPDEEDTFAEAMEVVVEKNFTAELDTLDSAEVSDEDKQLVKDEFADELLSGIKKDMISLFYSMAWQVAQDQCVNDDYFFKYLVHNMKMQAKKHQLDELKRKSEEKRLDDGFYIPLDGPWNESRRNE